MIPEGEYTARASDAMNRETDGGKDFVYVLFTIQGGDQDGRKIAESFYLTDAAWEHSIKKLKACGFKGEDITDLSGIKELVRITVEHEVMLDKNKLPLVDKTTGQPRQRARVGFVNAIAGGREPDAAKKSLLSERMAKLLAAKAVEAVAPAATPATVVEASKKPRLARALKNVPVTENVSVANGSAAPAPPVADDDVPF